MHCYECQKQELLRTYHCSMMTIDELGVSQERNRLNVVNLSLSQSSCLKCIARQNLYFGIEVSVRLIIMKIETVLMSQCRAELLFGNSVVADLARTLSQSRASNFHFVISMFIVLS